MYVLLDAVDESMPRGNLLKVVRDLSTDQRLDNIQLLVTSREYIDIETVMSSLSTSLYMSTGLVEEDVRIYVQSQLAQHPKLQQ